MNTFPYDTVIFDLDGTLFDAEEGIIASALYAMQQVEHTSYEEVDLSLMVGPPLRYSFTNIFNLPTEKHDDAFQHYREHFANNGMYQYSVYPHIRSLLAMLKKQNVYIAVATAKSTDIAEKILKYFGLYSYFNRVVGKEVDEKNASKANVIRRALPERYKNACMVGDRMYDIEAAIEVGIDAIGAEYGCGSYDELFSSGATYIVPDTESLRVLLCPGQPIPRGFFLTVEGPDGSGKSTQVNLLEKNLKKFGFSVLRTREPGGCRISEDIRKIILDPENLEMSSACEALLYAAARAQHVHQVISPAVDTGFVVLCDRFVDSSIAYQGGGRELGFETVSDINRVAVQQMKPDATLYLAIDHEEALNRRLTVSAPDRLEMENYEFHERVQKSYERLIKENKKRFHIVDATLPIEQIEKDALNLLLPLLDNHTQWEEIL